MTNFLSASGRVTRIDDFPIVQNDPQSGCYKLFSLMDRDGTIVNFVVEPTTYFVEHVKVKVGDFVTGFLDADAPVPLIYPPQYRAIVMAKDNPNYFVKVSFFNSQLISSDGNLKLNLSGQTEIVLENGQEFTGNPANRDLVVIYGASTRSIPAQTTPYEIVVLC
ncbi:hypothetical protein [Sporosarcina sp. Marseille-Q4943]|uniref:hypothetical protein n=1 Tax=Sporosarcina sp. Marseille-Q4943 TaxID=2942204 RepID=UPI00208DC3A5|nr:hypothetical protein [Sporosarcina sp. Marseille-Q4943]